MIGYCSQVKGNQTVKYLSFCVGYVELSLNLSGSFVLVRVYKYVVVTVVLSNCSSLIKMYLRFHLYIGVPVHIRQI